MANFDVIVAGVGAMGSAALQHLGSRGARVLGIEPHGIPHGRGSSGGDTRLIRKAYFEHPDYVPLLERAYENWHALEAATGVALLHQVGILYLGRPDSALVSGARRAAECHRLPLSAVSEDELVEVYPQFKCPAGFEALFEPEAGYVLAERTVRTQAAAALTHGASLVIGEQVVSWRAGAADVEVITNGGRYRAGALVLTAGSWTARLLEGLPLALKVTRQPLFWVQPQAPAPFALGRLPCWAVERPDTPGLYYGFPALPADQGSHMGVKLAHHSPGVEVDPDGRREPPERQELDAVLRAVEPFLPGLKGPLTAAHTCLYTSSVDGHFVVDVHPEHARVVFACGFSGHGFKFAPVMGEALADLALEGVTRLPVDFLRLR